ncbi:hypothetical protein J007_00278 [Cryptococcus neoformans]|nr:hypothetical protein J007_00278 [Cryptococcus neoformans var. grubii]OXC66289.1 hypothetical protein C358_00274 [Cryptococcus neoformans var. grubii MW-RSA852]
MATPPIALLNSQIITTISSNADHNSDEQPSSKPALKTQDSLQNTRNFYGAQSDLSSGDSVHHSPSISSRLRDKLVRAQSNSHISALSPRPTSPSSGPLPTTSPLRSPIPLPTPKGFLTPKKPAAAGRLEKSKAKRLMPSGVSNVGSTFDVKISGNSEVEGNDALRAPSPLEQYSAVEIPPNQGLRTNSTPERPLPLHSTLTAWETGLATVPRNVHPIVASASASQEGWDRPLRHSLTTASSPPKGAPMELSSDNLVRREAGEKPSLRHLKRQSHSRTTFERIRHQNNVSKPSQQRKYMSFENPLSTFILGGHVLIGGDTWYSMALVLAMLLGISGVWLGTTGVWMWLHGTEYGLAKGGGIAATIIFVYLFGMTTTSFVVTAFRDPGIIPRRLDPDPPMAQVDDWWEAYPRELTVQNGRVSVKYCETCETYRPPRCSHCRLCGNCVDGIDHHCSYLHTCVGKRNYFSFIVLLITSSISDIYIVILSAIHFSLLCHHDNISFKNALSNSPGAAVSFLLGILAIIPVLFLLQYHIRLLLFNITTLEQIRANTSKSLFAMPKRPDNPFSGPSLVSNVLLASLARPQFPSWIDASGWKQEDKRQINPALRDWRFGREWA